MSPASAPAPSTTARSEPIYTGGAPLLERISARAFRLLVLGIYAAGLLLASLGMQRLASLRANYYLGEVRARAVSPLHYGAALPALHALAAPRAGDVRIIVRADSAGGGASSLCALATALEGEPSVTWAAKTSAIQPCVAQVTVRVSSAAAGELARARWVLVGRGGRVLHSGWDVPDPGTLRETAALFAAGQVGAPGP